MAGMVKQNMKPGTPDKPTGLSDRASAEWDRLIGELEASGIHVSRAHRGLISQAATIAADIATAWAEVQKDGSYLTNPKTGIVYQHPAAKRLDILRRDYVKVMSLIGLRAAVQVPSTSGETLEDILRG